MIPGLNPNPEEAIKPATDSAENNAKLHENGVEDDENVDGENKPPRTVIKRDWE